MARLVELEGRLRNLGASYDDVVPSTPGLERRVMARLTIVQTPPATRPTWRREFALAGALVVFIGAVAIAFASLRALNPPQKAAKATPAPTATVTAAPTAPIPAGDLYAAGLGSVAAMVTRFDLQATDQGHTATLIAGYADSAQVVTIFNIPGATRLTLIRTQVMINDDQGLINASGSNRPGVAGDLVAILDGGPHPGADGLAHLTMQLTQWPPGNGALQPTARWTFAVALAVHRGSPIAAPTQFQLGRWKANIETLELTPTVVHAQLVINGASPPEITLETVSLIDAAGTIIGQGCGAGITVSKTQIPSASSPLYHNARVYCEFARPSARGLYRLVFVGAGGSYVIPVVIPGPVPTDQVGR